MGYLLNPLSQSRFRLNDPKMSRKRRGERRKRKKRKKKPLITGKPKLASVIDLQ